MPGLPDSGVGGLAVPPGHEDPARFRWRTCLGAPPPLNLRLTWIKRTVFGSDLSWIALAELVLSRPMSSLPYFRTIATTKGGVIGHTHKQAGLKGRFCWTIMQQNYKTKCAMYISHIWAGTVVPCASLSISVFKCNCKDNCAIYSVGAFPNSSTRPFVIDQIGKLSHLMP